MSVIYVLIPLAIIIILIAIGIFFWAVKSDQFNDLERQGYSILFDEDIQPTSNSLEKDTTEKDALEKSTLEKNTSNKSNGTKKEGLNDQPSHATNQQSSPSEQKASNK